MLAQGPHRNPIPNTLLPFKALQISHASRVEELGRQQYYQGNQMDSLVSVFIIFKEIAPMNDKFASTLVLNP